MSEEKKRIKPDLTEGGRHGTTPNLVKYYITRWNLVGKTLEEAAGIHDVLDEWIRSFPHIFLMQGEKIQGLNPDIPVEEVWFEGNFVEMLVVNLNVAIQLLTSD